MWHSNAVQDAQHTLLRAANTGAETEASPVVSVSATGHSESVTGPVQVHSSSAIPYRLTQEDVSLPWYRLRFKVAMSFGKHGDSCQLLFAGEDQTMSRQTPIYAKAVPGEHPSHPFEVAGVDPVKTKRDFFGLIHAASARSELKTTLDMFLLILFCFSLIDFRCRG